MHVLSGIRSTISGSVGPLGHRDGVAVQRAGPRPGVLRAEHQPVAADRDVQQVGQGAVRVGVARDQQLHHDDRIPRRRGGEVEAGVHVEPEPAVGVDVGPEQRAQPATFRLAHQVVELRGLQNGLDEQRVDVHQRRLEQVQGEHRGLGVLAVRAGEVAVLAVEDHGVARVPVLHHLQPAMDLAAQLGIGEVVAGEDRAHGPAKLFKRGVGGVLGAAAGEPAQHLLGLRRAEPQRGGVADHLVVLLGRVLRMKRGLSNETGQAASSGGD